MQVPPLVVIGADGSIRKVELQSIGDADPVYAPRGASTGLEAMRTKTKSMLPVPYGVEWNPKQRVLFVSCQPVRSRQYYPYMKAAHHEDRAEAFQQASVF